MVGISLGRTEELLALRSMDMPATFARVGKRFIVNLNYIYKINTLKQTLVLSDQRTFSYEVGISKIALKALKELISPSKPTEKTGAGK